MKVCSKWMCLEAFWVDSECFYALSWRSRWLLKGVCSHFVIIYIYGCFWTIFGPFWSIQGPFWDPNGTMPFVEKIYSWKECVGHVVWALTECSPSVNKLIYVRACACAQRAPVRPTRSWFFRRCCLYIRATVLLLETVFTAACWQSFFLIGLRHWAALGGIGCPSPVWTGCATYLRNALEWAGKKRRSGKSSNPSCGKSNTKYVHEKWVWKVRANARAKMRADVGKQGNFIEESSYYGGAFSFSRNTAIELIAQELVSTKKIRAMSANTANQKYYVECGDGQNMTWIQSLINSWWKPPKGVRKSGVNKILLRLSKLSFPTTADGEITEKQLVGWTANESGARLWASWFRRG